MAVPPEIQRVMSATAPAPASAPEAPPAPKSSVVIPQLPFDTVYQFKISRRAEPKEFKNLWQLLVKGPQDAGPVELVDADSLSTVLDKIRLVFEQDGL